MRIDGEKKKKNKAKRKPVNYHWTVFVRKNKYRLIQSLDNTCALKQVRRAISETAQLRRSANDCKILLPFSFFLFFFSSTELRAHFSTFLSLFLSRGNRHDQIVETDSIGSRISRKKKRKGKKFKEIQWRQTLASEIFQLAETSNHQNPPAFYGNAQSMRPR